MSSWLPSWPARAACCLALTCEWPRPARQLSASGRARWRTSRHHRPPLPGWVLKILIKQLTCCAPKTFWASAAHLPPQTHQWSSTQINPSCCRRCPLLPACLQRRDGRRDVHVHLPAEVLPRRLRTQPEPPGGVQPLLVSRQGGPTTVALAQWWLVEQQRCHATTEKGPRAGGCLEGTPAAQARLQRF